MVLRCGLLLAAVPLPARGQPDPTPDPDLVRVARFQVRALADTASRLQKQQKKGAAEELYLKACQVGWARVEAAGSRPDSDLVDLALETAGAAEKLMALVAGGTETGITLKDILSNQIQALVRVGAPVETRFRWMKNRLEFGAKELEKEARAAVNLQELASWIAEGARTLAGREGGGDARREERAAVSGITDAVLERSWQALGTVPDQQGLITGIVADLCAGSPGAAGRERIRRVLAARVEKLHEQGGTTPELRARRLFHFYRLLQVVRESHREYPAELEGFEAKYLAKELRRLVFRVREVDPKTVKGWKEGSLWDLSPYAAAGPPPDRYELGLLLGGGNEITWLQKPADLGLSAYHLPLGPYPCLLRVATDRGPFLTIFRVPLMTRDLDVCLPSRWPRDLVFLPVPGSGGTGEPTAWSLAAKPLTKGEFGTFVFALKKDDRAELTLDLKALFTAVLGDISAGLYKPEDLREKLAELPELAGARAELDGRGAALARKVFLGSPRSAGTFTLPDREVGRLFRRFLAVTGRAGEPGGAGAPGPGPGSGWKGRVLADEAEEGPPGKPERYLVFDTRLVPFTREGR